jgi:hypothetical protein
MMSPRLLYGMKVSWWGFAPQSVELEPRSRRIVARHVKLHPLLDCPSRCTRITVGMDVANLYTSLRN